ncbi:MAG: FGGY family carbohydrate kinase [Acidimicrobiales bacterium]
MRALVIDIGTSGLRAAVVNNDASVTDLHHEEFAPQSPAGGLVEFDASAMYDAVLRVSNAAMNDRPVDCVGITNQRASAIGWRRSTGMPIGPSIGWQDLRTVGECMMARAEHGLALAPNQSATKFAWLLTHHVADPAARADDDILFGTVETWITWRLSRGAAHVTDRTNAAVTGLTTASGTEWNPSTVSVLGLHLHQLPTIVPTMGRCADAVDLPGAPPITALVGDQQASMVGQGCISPGRAKITFGTGGMLDLYTGTTPPVHGNRSGNGTFPIVAHSDAHTTHYGVEAVMLSAGTNIEWLRDDMGLIASAADTDAIAASVPDAGGVVYVPALLGLGTPHWDYGARGTMLGITRGTTRSHVVRAVLEGVAHRGVDLIEAAERDSGLDIGTVSIDGGMSRNSTFVQALADAAGRPVTVSPVTEATTLGAGLLAAVAAGHWGGLHDACATVAGHRTVEPLGEPGIPRSEWAQAVSRARSWIPGLSALDF